MKITRHAIAGACLIFGACGGSSTGTPLVGSDGPNAVGAYDAGGPTSGSTGGGNPGGSAGGNVGANGGNDNCEEHVVKATIAAPDMLIVLDRSGSMNASGNPDNTDRWGGSRDAVMQVTSDFGDRVRFGLMTFPAFSQGGRGDQCAPGTVNVPIATGQGPAIATALQSMNAGGRTPTAPTLQDALPVIGSGVSGPDQVQGAKYILLVTDGDPNCSSQTSGGSGQADPVARQQTIDAIKALTAAGVSTYVVGYQTAGSNFASTLDTMAAAGGTGDTMHRSVASGADLTSTFSQIAGGVVSCSFKLDDPVADASYVLVTVDNTPRKLDNQSDGWVLGTDNQTVTLTGAACDAVKAGGVFAVQVKCTVVEIQ